MRKKKNTNLIQSSFFEIIIRMKQFLRKIFPASAAVVIIIFVFAGGYFMGVRSSVNIEALLPENITQEKDTSINKVDLTSFWKAWNILDNNFAGASTSKKTTDQAKVWGAIEGLAASYGDPYTNFFPPEELKRFQDDVDGNFEGVGIEIVVKDGILTVVSPLKGTPADRAGLKAKDLILKIDDKSTVGMSAEDATKLIRGPKGKTVKFTISRDGKEKEISVVRDVIDVPVVEYKQRDDGVFVITISSFAGSSAEKFRDALREFVKTGDSKLIIDVRGNPGGYLEAAVDIASWFLPADKIVVQEDYGNKKPRDVLRSHGYDIFTDKLKLVMLVDEGSASASEILAGALKEQGKATLVGTKTFGKGSVQEVIPVTDDSSLKVTIAHWLTPNGNSISNTGVDPDVTVKISEADKTAGKDPQLDKALEILAK